MLPVPEPALALWLVEQAAERGALLHVSSSETQLARVQAAETFAGTGVEVLARQHLGAVRRRFAGTGLLVEGLRATTGPAGRAALRKLSAARCA